MKNVKLLLIIWLTLFSQSLFSQIDLNTLVFSDGKYFYQNKIYTKKNVKEVLITNEKAYKIYNQYKSFRTIGHVGVVGTILVGGYAYVVSQTITGVDTNQTVLVIGVALIFPIGVTMGLYSAGDKRLKKSVEIFNAENRPADMGVLPLELKIGTTQNGVGLVLNF